MAIVSEEFSGTWVVFLRRSGFGDAMVLPGGETITYDSSLYDVQSGDTVAQAFKQIIDRAPAPQDGSDFDGLKADRLGQIEAWWDNHPGIDVGNSIMLPVGDAQVALNGVQLTLWQQAGDFTAPLRVVDRNAITVEIAGADVGTALAVFYAGYKNVGDHYDVVKNAIMAATTIEQLLKISIYPEA
jgi:hypothetical protein